MKGAFELPKSSNNMYKKQTAKTLIGAIPATSAVADAGPSVEFMAVIKEHWLKNSAYVYVYESTKISTKNIEKLNFCKIS